MGASSRPRKNPFVTQGLAPGLTLRMDVTVHNHVESYVTRVEDVDADRVAVLVPMARLRIRPLEVGTIVHAGYDHREKLWTFVTEVSGHNADSTIEYLRAPTDIDCRERRGSFRLKTAIRPRTVYRLVVEAEHLNEESQDEIECSIVDLSEGGVCLSSRGRFHSGERLGIQIELPQGGWVNARMRVVSIDEPRKGQLARKIHCAFTDIGLSDRDRIARYMMQRQLEMRRRGQL